MEKFPSTKLVLSAKKLETTASEDMAIWSELCGQSYARREWWCWKRRKRNGSQSLHPELNLLGLPSVQMSEGRTVGWSMTTLSATLQPQQGPRLRVSPKPQNSERFAGASLGDLMPVWVKNPWACLLWVECLVTEWLWTTPQLRVLQELQ